MVTFTPDYPGKELGEKVPGWSDKSPWAQSPVGLVGVVASNQEAQAVQKRCSEECELLTGAPDKVSTCIIR